MEEKRYIPGWVLDPNKESHEGCTFWICNRQKVDNGGKIEDAYWIAAAVRFDGCITLSFAGNQPYCESYGFDMEERDPDLCDQSIHICNLPNHLKICCELLALNPHAKK